MVYRIYVEKKPGFDVEANGLKNELTSLLGIKDLTGLRLLNRYDVEGIDEALFNQCVSTVFSEPPFAARRQQQQRRRHARVTPSVTAAPCQLPRKGELFLLTESTAFDGKHRLIHFLA